MRSQCVRMQPLTGMSCQQVSGQDGTRQSLYNVVKESSLVWRLQFLFYRYRYIYDNRCVCVCEVDRDSIYSELLGPALETAALLWIFKEPIYN